MKISVRAALAAVVGSSAIVASAIACSTFTSTGANPTASDAGADSRDDDASNEGDTGLHCGGAHGSSMVLVDGVCVDHNEATFADYQNFLMTVTPFPSFPLDGVCTAKLGTAGDASTDTTGDAGCSTTLAGDPVNADQGAPVVCVDWCDAWAFCNWAGKHLCGSVVDGGPVDFTEYFDAGASEWIRACTQGGTNDLPATGACNNSSSGLQKSWDVVGPSAVTNCEGPPGVYDMIGNVAEWVNACDNSQECRISQASFAPVPDPGSEDNTSTHCSNPEEAMRLTRRTDIGIRCCAMPTSK